jgi:lipopolysaccharide export system permease protein
MLNRIDTYIVRAILAPLFATLGIAALLQVLERMLSLFDFVINQGGPLSVVWQMLGNLFPQYLSLSLPIGFFLGCQLAVRKLSLNSEYDAFSACGYGLHNWLRPALFVAFILMICSLILTSYIQPYSRYTYSGLIFDVRSGALGASIKAGEFTKIGDDVTLRIEGSRQEGKMLSHIFVQKREKGGRILAITAREGSFFITNNEQTLLLRLHDGLLLDLQRDQMSPRVLTFTVHDLKIDLPAIKAFRSRGDATNEMTLPELWQAAVAAPDAKKRAPFLSPFTARIVRAFMLLVIPFVALPLGMVGKRSSSTLGLTVGLILVLLWHKTLEFGESFSAMGEISIPVGIFLPSLVFALIGARLFHTAGFHVGAMPLGKLQAGWDVLRGLKKLFIRRAKRAL